MPVQVPTTSIQRMNRRLLEVITDSMARFEDLEEQEMRHFFYHHLVSVLREIVVLRSKAICCSKAEVSKACIRRFTPTNCNNLQLSMRPRNDVAQTEMAMRKVDFIAREERVFDRKKLIGALEALPDHIFIVIVLVN